MIFDDCANKEFDIVRVIKMKKKNFLVRNIALIILGYFLIKDDDFV
jgi:hypothetical protein